MATSMTYLPITSPTSASQTYNLNLASALPSTWIAIRGTNTFNARLYKTFPNIPVAVDPVSLTASAGMLIGSGSLAGTYQADLFVSDSPTAHMRLEITSNTGSILSIAVENAG